jgi:hypothetical protein
MKLTMTIVAFALALIGAIPAKAEEPTLDLMTQSCAHAMNTQTDHMKATNCAPTNYGIIVELQTDWSDTSQWELDDLCRVLLNSDVKTYHLDRYSIGITLKLASGEARAVSCSYPASQAEIQARLDPATDYCNSIEHQPGLKCVVGLLQNAVKLFLAGTGTNADMKYGCFMVLRQIRDRYNPDYFGLLVKSTIDGTSAICHLGQGGTIQYDGPAS